MRTVNAEPSRGQPDTVPVSGVRTYTRLWLSQWLAVFAAALTVMVLGFDLYAAHGSLLLLAVGYVIMLGPFPLLSPIAGALVDRWGHRRVLLLSNAVTLAYLLVLVVLMVTDTLGPWQINTILGIWGATKSLQLAALESVVPLLVPKRHIGRANAPRLLLTATGVMVGPVLVWLLLLVVEPVVVILLECAAVAFAIAVLRTVRIPPAQPAGGEVPRGSLRADVLAAWSHLRSRRGLVALLGVLATISCILAVLEFASAESVFAFAAEGGLMVVIPAAWFGVLVVSVVMLIWGWPRRLMPGLLGAGVAFAAALVLGALRPNVALMAVAGFLAMGSAAMVMAIIQTVLHTKVEPRLLGRAFGLKNTVISSAHIVGNVTIRVLAVVVLVRWEELHLPAVSALVGDGPGRGHAFAMLVAGVLTALAMFLLFRYQRLRRLQDDLPDVTPGDRTAPVTTAPTTSPVVAASTPGRT